MDNKIFIKKTITKLALFGIGADMIYRFYRISGLSKRISELSRPKVEVPKEKDVLMVLNTTQDNVLKIKQKGEYVINTMIKDIHRFASVRVQIDGKDMSDEEFTQRHVNTLVVLDPIKVEMKPEEVKKIIEEKEEKQKDPVKKDELIKKNRFSAIM